MTPVDLSSVDAAIEGLEAHFAEHADALERGAQASVQAFGAMVVAAMRGLVLAEREVCAKVADDMAARDKATGARARGASEMVLCASQTAAERIAKAIRARSEVKP